MKQVSWLFLLAIILTAGCVHKTPITTDHTIEIDPQLIGLWESIAGEAKDDPDEDRMLVLKWSETEFLAQLPMGAKGEFYRAYLVEIGGRTLLQAESVGNSVGRQFPTDRMSYPVLSYELVEGILILSTLNPEVVDEEIADSAALRQAYLENKDKPGLFNPPAHFRKVQDQ